MHKCILKLLKSHIEAMLREFHTADGSWKQLKENLQLVQQWNPQELGVFVPTPDFVDVEKMKVKFVTMQKMYSPEKKVMLLLRVCKLIYTVMENNSGRLYGADDFLPVLTYVLVQGDTLELDTETEYMVELLDPSLLHGEGGYYLASTYGALVLIKNFQEDQSAQLLSSEARDTLWRWHKRRTANKTMPSVDDFQNCLRVAFQEVNSACTGKTLLVRPYITTADVCQLCAEKFKVDNPEEYSLFLFVDDTRQQLTEDTYPQKIKTELHGRPQPQVFRSVYKHINALGKVEGSVAGEERLGRVTALPVAPEFQRLGLVAKLMKLLGEISEKKGGFFVDLFVRVSNRVAVNMYKQLGYRVYRTVSERYSASSGEADEDAYNTRKALSRDTEKKSIIPLPHPVRPEDTE